MTPLQAILAVELVTNASSVISSYKMRSIINEYTENKLSKSVNEVVNAWVSSRPAPDPADPNPPAKPSAKQILSQLPNVMANSIPSELPLFLAESGVTAGEDTLSGSLIEYCSFALGGGDATKFSQIMDKVNSFTSSTGEVLDTINKAKTMNFSDFGPDVKSHVDAASMGVGPVVTKVATSIKDDAGKLPHTESMVKTEQQAVSRVLSAQGSVAGDPADPNYGTAIGMYNAAKKKGMKDVVTAIHQSFIDNVGVTFTSACTGVPMDFYMIRISTTATPDDLNDLLHTAEMKSISGIKSSSIADQSSGEMLGNWVSSIRSQGHSVFMPKVKAAAMMTFELADKPDQHVSKQAIINATLKNEAKMKQAIDGLSPAMAQKMFDGLGAKIQVEKLEKYTDILDMSKVAAALPAPASTTDKQNEPDPPAVEAIAAEGMQCTPENSGGSSVLTEAKEVASNAAAATSSAISSTTSAIGSVSKSISSTTSSITGGIDSAAKSITGSLKSGADASATSPLGKAVVGGAASIASTVVTGVTGIASGVIKTVSGVVTNTLDKVNSGLQKLDKAANAVKGLADKAEKAPAKIKALGEDMKQIKGFGNATPAAIKGMIQKIEVLAPAAALNSINEVMPADVRKRFIDAMANVPGAAKPIKGTASNGGYKVTDFLGSVSGLNGQPDHWHNIRVKMDELADDAWREEIYTFVSAETQADLINSINNFWIANGSQVEAEFSEAFTKFNNEWLLLTRRAEIDYTKLRPGSFSSAIALTKKVGQVASKVSSGVTEIFNSVANPATTGGQALTATMVESRNIKVMHKAGLDPVNDIRQKPDVADTDIYVTDADRARAKRIQDETGDPTLVTPEQVARDRMLLNTADQA